MIAIIDYGIGNLGSIKNMLKKVGSESVVLAKTDEDVVAADKYILPGVGAFDSGMRMLNQSGMRKELDRQILEYHKPVLGICLGMQMLGEGSEEGVEKGLGYIPFSCVKFQFQSERCRIPHMGWDYVNIQKETSLTLDCRENSRFYFVHSYYAKCKHSEDILLTCEYGITFAAGVNRDNIYGVQFHPEKSHNYGKWLMENFMKKV